MNGINLILLGIIGYALYKKRNAIVDIVDKPESALDNINIPTEPTTTYSDPKPDPKPEPEPEPVPEPELEPVVYTDWFDESWMTNNKITQETGDKNLKVRIGLVNYKVIDKVVYQYGVIGIKNTGNTTQLLSGFSFGCDNVQNTQTGGQVCYSSYPFYRAVSTEDAEYDLSSKGGIQKFRALQFAIAPGEIVYLNMLVCVPLFDNVAAIPLLVSDNFSKSPFSLNVYFNYYSQNNSVKNKYKGSIKFSSIKA